MQIAISAALVAALLSFVWIGLRAHAAQEDLDTYLTARNSQSANTLALSFLASGMGAWAGKRAGCRLGGLAGGRR